MHENGPADCVVDTPLQRALSVTRVRLDALRHDEELLVPEVQSACRSNGAIERSCIIGAFRRASFSDSSSRSRSEFFHSDS